MGQAGAQREPTMEEILASIRRIIENNEPGAEGNALGLGLAGGDAASQYDAHETAAEPVADNARTVAAETNDAVVTEASQHAAANDAAHAQPVSLAEVAARARTMPQAEETAPVEKGQGQSEEGLPSDPDAVVMDAAAEEMREALVSDEPVGSPAEPAAREPKPVVSETRPVAEPETEEPPVAGQAESAAATPSAEPERGGQLVSLQTGEKVAAAFNELDAAIAAGQQRSFDEIAEEMLRPMLTQWLDDNLPTLVERLVREEIERVSRGNRR